MLCRALISLSFLLLMAGCVTGKSGLGASESMRSTEARGETASSMSAPPDGSSGVASTQAKAHTKPAEVALRYPPLPRPWLGIEMQATAPEQGGVELVRIFRGSPAAKAGLLAGDQLLRLGDQAVNSPPELAQLVARFEPGAAVPAAVNRDGRLLPLRIVFEGEPEFEDRLRLAFVGQPAPSIDGVVTFQGEAASLGRLRGHVVLLEFWASWCGVCRYLAPVLNRLHMQHQPAGLTVVGVTVDSPERGRAAALRTGSMDYALASDPRGKVTREYLATQVPTVYLIDRQGKVVDVMVGVSEARVEEFQKLVEELLGAPS